ncbi:hypothetical protein E1B28_008712 [Marasmius oreades]|uniref:Uncharacterized protein n=1 Tax=Marasmius oreades TaxID=181124 RepID=A0A9P7RZ34_9AGAR|nr:uncharacterized protein E1B28_008712 [Marasmius oreades]KAG7092352.1 hypothetical protein E1B28_008712 [Marasmius oreades]
MSLVIATWTISGLLAAYACYLGIMSFIPQPPSPNETEATTGSTSRRRLSTDSMIPLVSKDTRPVAKAYSEEAQVTTSLRGTKIEKHPPPSISVSPPSYETVSKSALLAQFPVPPEHQSPQFPSRSLRSRPLPLPNPFSNRLIERSPSTSSSIPSSYLYWGSPLQQSLAISSQPTFSASSTHTSSDISSQSDRSGSRPRHPSLLTPATIPRGHFRPLPTPISSHFNRTALPRQYGLSLPSPAALPSYRDERQWATWHNPRYDVPQSASASVFSSRTMAGGNSVSARSTWR